MQKWIKWLLLGLLFIFLFNTVSCVVIRKGTVPWGQSKKYIEDDDDNKKDYTAPADDDKLKDKEAPPKKKK